MKIWMLWLSVLLNLVLVGVLLFLNDRYRLWAKVQRLAFEEQRIPGLMAQHERNRNYQVRREMFRLDRNESARILMLGDSLTAHGEWNAIQGKPLIANRGIDGDTSEGVLARLGDDADFRGDAVVIWIGTNDVLLGQPAGLVAERIMEVARRKSAKLEKGLTTEDTENTENTEKEAGPRLAGQAGTSDPDSLPSKLVDAPVSESLTRSASGPGPASLPATTPQAQVFVLGIPPIARWWEGARERNAVIREINARLAERAAENGCRFIELESVLADENGFLRGELTSDGVHLNAKGYVAVLEKMKEGPLLGR